MARIELLNLNKYFGAVQAVKNLTFTIEDGEFVVFVGPSGCGKTTTLRMIAGFEDPTSGEIRIDGQVVNDLEPRDRGLGMVFQSHALFPHKNVAQNIEFGLRMKKVPHDERVKRVREVAEMVRISHLLDKMPSQCSGGESQRVALARTLVTNPSTFLLDEPLSSLDAKLRRELRAECDRLHQVLNRTFIYVTHDQEEAMTLADRIVVMHRGEVVQVGSPLDIYSNPISYFVADFFGSPSMNLVAGEVTRADGGARFRSHELRAGPAGEPGRRQTRPRQPRHPARARCGHAQRRRATATLPVRLVEPLGKDTLLYFDDGSERAFVAVTEGLSMADVEVGARLGLVLAPERLHLFGADGRRDRREVIAEANHQIAKPPRRRSPTHDADCKQNAEVSMDYREKSEIRDRMRIDWDMPITMDDGVVLRCDIYRPVAEGRYPVIMTYGPYGKWLHFEDLYNDQWRRMCADQPDVPTNSTNKYQCWEVVDPEKWVPDGYIVIRVDSRGAGRSQGVIDIWSLREAQDLALCVDWAGVQPWSNGKVGLNGISYYAENQWQAAALQPNQGNCASPTAWSKA